MFTPWFMSVRMNKDLSRRNSQTIKKSGLYCGKYRTCIKSGSLESKWEEIRSGLKLLHSCKWSVCYFADLLPCVWTHTLSPFPSGSVGNKPQGGQPGTGVYGSPVAPVVSQGSGPFPHSTVATTPAPYPSDTSADFTQYNQAYTQVLQVCLKRHAGLCWAAAVSCNWRRPGAGRNKNGFGYWDMEWEWTWTACVSICPRSLPFSSLHSKRFTKPSYELFVFCFFFFPLSLHLSLCLLKLRVTYLIFCSKEKT